MGYPFCSEDKIRDVIRTRTKKMDALVKKTMTLQFPIDEADSRKSISERPVPLEELKGHLSGSHLGMCHAGCPLGALPVIVTQYSAEEWDVLYAVSQGDLDLYSQPKRIIKLFKRYFERHALC